MPSMRVHELAKELNMTSKELLDRLAAMKIPAKSHASVLEDAYVQKIRKNLAPEIKERAGIIEDEEAKKLAAEKAEAEARKAEEEAARRAAVEHERALREAERAKRQSAAGDSFAGGKQQAGVSAAPAKQPASPFASLADQIAQEKERVEREKAEAKIRARVAAAAKEVAKKQAVEERLHASRNGKGSSKNASTQPEAKPVKQVKAPSSSFDSLLSQIESEKERIAKSRSEKAPAKKQSGGKKHGGQQNARSHNFEPEVPELTVAPDSEDRYAQMAVQAEKLQRDKVLAEARAAVEAATHEGEGRRKKRKEKREAEARERAEIEAIEKGLDPDLVLDDSVVEIPEGSTVRSSPNFWACLRTTSSSACSCWARFSR